MALLINHGAEVTCKDKKGYTPLHAAASNGQITVVKHLLNLGVEVSSDSGITPWCLCELSVVLKLILCICGNFYCSEVKSCLHFNSRGEKTPHFLASYPFEFTWATDEGHWGMC